MPGPGNPVLAPPFTGPPAPFRPSVVYGTPKAAGGVSGASLAAPTLRYVRKTGSDSNGGTSPADAWLTINKALTTVASNTAVYIGAGVYREVVSVTITPTSLVQIIGDVTGQFTGDAGMVQWTAYLTNDKTAPSATTLLNLNGKSNLTFQNIMFVGGTAIIITATTATSQGITFRNCSVIGNQASAGSCLSLTLPSGGGVPANWLFDRCLFNLARGTGFTITCPQSATGSANNDIGFLVQNSLFVALTAQTLFSTSGAASSGSKPGGISLRGCSIFGGGVLFATNSANWSTSLPASIYGCVLVTPSTALNANNSGQIVEDYNLIYAATPRTNVSAGAHSISDGSYAPLFQFGQELQWGGTQRPFGEPMQSSPLRAFGAPDTSAGPLDIRGIPRPSSPSQWDVGAYQRGNTAVQTTTVVQAGSSAIQIVGNGTQDFDVPVNATATALSIWIRYDSNYTGPLPQIQVVKAQQVGVGDYTLPVSTNSLNAYAQYTIPLINPTANGIVTLRIVSGDTSGAGNVYCDAFSVS